MQYSCLLAQCSTQPSNGGRAVKAASVGSSIYNLSSRSPAHSECSQSPVISDRFASLPCYPSPSTHLHPIYSLDLPNYPPSIMLSPTPNLQLFLLYLPNYPFTYPPNSPSPPTSPGDVGKLVTHRRQAAPSHHQGLSCCSPTELFHRSHPRHCRCLHFQQLLSTHPASG